MGGVGESGIEARADWEGESIVLSAFAWSEASGVIPIRSGDGEALYGWFRVCAFRAAVVVGAGSGLENLGSRGINYGAHMEREAGGRPSRMTTKLEAKELLTVPLCCIRPRLR